MKNYIFACSILLTLNSCVSVNLANKKSSPAKNVVYDSPASPFAPIKMSNVDQAWLSSGTGNTISFFSECSLDPSLEVMTAEALSAMSDAEILSTSQLNYNSRSAQETTARGKVDGVSVKMTLLVFKKNACNFTLTYGGKENNYSNEISIFDNFKKSFKAP